MDAQIKEKMMQGSSIGVPPGENQDGRVVANHNIGGNESYTSSSAHGRLQSVAHYPPAPKRFSVPETTPQWRFVRNAKKSEGYSSVSAGRIVQGQSAKELVKDYTLPTNARVVQNALYDSSSSDDEHSSSISSSDDDHGNGATKEVGKLSINETNDTYEQSYDGTFGGSNKENGSSKEIIKCEKKLVKLDTQNDLDDLDTLDGEMLEDPMLDGTKDIMDDEMLSEKELIDDQNAKHEKPLVVPERELSVLTGEDGALDRNEKTEANNEVVVMENESFPSHQPTKEAISNVSNDDDNNHTHNNPRRYLLRGMCAVIMLLLCAIGAMIGVIVSRNDNLDGPTNSPNLRGEVANAKDTNKPSFAPSLSPTNNQSVAEVVIPAQTSEETITCPSDSKQFNLRFKLGQSPSRISWTIYDRCTQDFFYRCNNCYENVPPSYPVSFGGCLPASYELTGIERGYVLQASNFGGTGDYGYHLKYNESVVEGSGALQLSNFGEVEVACDVALGLTDKPSAQPTTSHDPTAYPSGSPTESSRPSTSAQPTYNPSNLPSPQPSLNPSSSTHPTTSPSFQPTSSLPPLRNITHPPGSSYPCKEVIESELVGRIIDLNGEFCGFCRWKFSSFNCYQRVIFLITRYQMTEVSARQGLIDQGWCGVPTTFSTDEQWLLNQTVYCDGRPTPEPTSRPTASPFIEPTPNPSLREPRRTADMFG